MLNNNLTNISANISSIKLFTTSIRELSKNFVQLISSVSSFNSSIEPLKKFFEKDQILKESKNNFLDYLKAAGQLFINLVGFAGNIAQILEYTKVSFVKLKSKILDFASNLKENIASGFDRVKTIALGAKDGIMNTLSNAGTGIRNFGGRVAGLARNLGGMIKSLNLGQRAMALFNLVASLNPIGLIIIAIMAVVGGIILVVKHWDFVKEKIAQFIAWVIENSPFGFIINVIDNIFPGFKDALGGLFNWVVDTFTKIADFIKSI